MSMERTVTIQGNEDAIERARGLIDDIVNSMPPPRVGYFVLLRVFDAPELTSTSSNSLGDHMGLRVVVDLEAEAEVDRHRKRRSSKFRRNTWAASSVAEVPKSRLWNEKLDVGLLWRLRERGDRTGRSR